MGCVNGAWTRIIQVYFPWRALALTIPNISGSFSIEKKIK
jgi:hypothetical protein